MYNSGHPTKLHANIAAVRNLQYSRCWCCWQHCFDRGHAAAGVKTFSAGIQFGTTMTNKNAFVYGTFTPVMLFGGRATGFNYSTQKGEYVRIGPCVFVNITLVQTVKGTGTGSVTTHRATRCSRVDPMQFNLFMLRKSRGKCQFAPWNGCARYRLRNRFSDTDFKHFAVDWGLQSE